MRKPKATKPKTIKSKVQTKGDLLAVIKDQETLLTQARGLMDAMQTEIKQLTSMHRTQLQIIDNLSTKIREDS